MKIVDAHFHLWDLDANYYPWLQDGDRTSVVPNFQSLRRNYLVSDFMRDAEGLQLVAAVHIQAEHDPRDHVRETRWLQGVADAPASRGLPQAIVANVDLAAPDARAVMDGHRAFANLRGVRQAVHRRLHESPPYDPLEDSRFHAGFAWFATMGLSFDLQLFPEQAAGALRLVDAFPQVQFILTHLGMPYPQQAERHALWRGNMQAFARRPNVAVKISGFGMFDPAWTADSVRPMVSQVVDWFGVQRCALASNFPVEGIVTPYRQVWERFDTLFQGASAAERDQLFWRTAQGLYRLAP
jgi:predicted TIM-barrel fold metal-dependent hydrolase